MQGEGLSDVNLQVLKVLVSVGKDGVSVKEITKTTKIDALDIQEVLENWFEFLIQKHVDKETHYSLYHVNFCDWLAKKIR